MKQVMSNEWASERTCPKCGTRLAENTAEGLCPACLLALNPATQTELPNKTGPAYIQAAHQDTGGTEKTLTLGTNGTGYFDRNASITLGLDSTPSSVFSSSRSKKPQ